MTFSLDIVSVVVTRHFVTAAERIGCVSDRRPTKRRTLCIQQYRAIERSLSLQALSISESSEPDEGRNSRAADGVLPLYTCQHQTNTGGYT